MLRTLVRLPRLLLIGLVRVYQVVLSPHIGASCRFRPTCSQYAVEALERYGAVRGSILAAYRVLRCNPWGGHGYDPPRWFTEAAGVHAPGERDDGRDSCVPTTRTHELRSA